MMIMLKFKKYGKNVYKYRSYCFHACSSTYTCAYIICLSINKTEERILQYQHWGIINSIIAQILYLEQVYMQKSYIVHSSPSIKEQKLNRCPSLVSGTHYGSNIFTEGHVQYMKRGISLVRWSPTSVSHVQISQIRISQGLKYITLHYASVKLFLYIKGKR